MGGGEGKGVYSGLATGLAAFLLYFNPVQYTDKRRVKIYIEKKDGTRVSQYIFVTDAEYKRLKKDYSFAQKILNLEEGDEIVDFKASKKRFVENDSGKMVKG